MRRQGGGFAVGLIVGVLIGLVLSLGVAVYVTNVPVPFINKVPPHTPEQDAAEAARNKNWDPNAALRGESAQAKPAAPAAALPPASGNPGATLPAKLPPAALPPAVAKLPGAATPPAAPAAATPETRTLSFYAQAGAFSRRDDAEAQRAKLTLMGMNAKITEREQSGRTVYRVRVGPFDQRAGAEQVLTTLRDAKVDASLVRVEPQ